MADLCIFAIPKPFRGEIDAIQRRAFESWRAIGAEIVLVGDEEGTAEVARDLGARHMPELERGELGTPLVRSAFAAAERVARAQALCYANADMVFSADLLAAVHRVRGRRPFLLVGRRREDGRVGTDHQIDYFAFPRGIEWELPPFAVGRPVWDNWLIWRARKLGLRVVDATQVVVAVHQPHGYGHVPEAAGAKWEGPEAEWNRALMGDTSRRYSILDATHVLTRRGLFPALAPAYLKRRARRHPLLGRLLVRLDRYRTRS